MSVSLAMWTGLRSMVIRPLPVHEAIRVVEKPVREGVGNCFKSMEDLVQEGSL